MIRGQRTTALALVLLAAGCQSAGGPTQPTGPLIGFDLHVGGATEGPVGTEPTLRGELYESECEVAACTHVPLPTEVEWQTSGGGVAGLEITGPDRAVVHFLKAGNATIRASAGGHQREVVVTVTP